MSLIDLVLVLVVAGICGTVGQAIVGYSRGGCLASIGLGFIGALIGLWLQRATSLPEFLLLNIGATRFPVIWSIIGAALFVAVISLFARRRV